MPGTRNTEELVNNCNYNLDFPRCYEKVEEVVSVWGKRKCML